ncbi:Ubiquitin_4 domain-containing protein [Hirschfeldia incana]|nr:Ubiquitin_4 domain-containing protein [Hirschfeldia incana]
MEVPRRSLAASISPLRLIDGLPRRRSFNYNQMPEEPIKLTVLKLDGSSFDIQVMKTATVGELKMAVEAAFSHLPITGVGKVSWPHVWAQFCLSYEDHRLLNEADYLIEFGIKDGDQLRFIRHISNYCTMMVNHKKKTRDHNKTPHVSSLKQLKLPSRFSFKTDTWKKRGTQGQEDGVDSITTTQTSFLSTVLGGWLSYKSTPSQRGTKQRNVTASTSSHLKAFNNLIARFRFKCYSDKDVWNRKKLISENMK